MRKSRGQNLRSQSPEPTCPSQPVRWTSQLLYYCTDSTSSTRVSLCYRMCVFCVNINKHPALVYRRIMRLVQLVSAATRNFLILDSAPQFLSSQSPYFLADVIGNILPRQAQFRKVHDNEDDQGSDSVFYSLISVLQNARVMLLDFNVSKSLFPVRSHRQSAIWSRYITISNTLYQTQPV